jgi:hypothetical protein
MKKRKHGNNWAVNGGNNKLDKQMNDTSDDINEGFGNWLRSSEGAAYMRLFVIANSIVIIMTMTWPCVADIIEIISSYFTK